MNSVRLFVKNNSKRFFICSMLILSSSSLYSTYQTSNRIKERQNQINKNTEILNIKMQTKELKLKLENENNREKCQMYRDKLDELETKRLELIFDV